MLIDTIRKDLNEATKRQNPLELKTIRFILSEINYAQIDRQKDLTDEDIVLVLQKEVKKRNEAIDMMKKAGRDELVTEEQNKLEYITKYLPQQIGDSELEQIVITTKESMPDAQMGQLIGAVMGKVKGKADGSRVAALVRKHL